ncbi:MAG: hypothetical protein H6669_17030 [Ardenticatenaceae bacterium]|nr:hypothetical protein [Ardenticatenaceae bacterium]
MSQNKRILIALLILIIITAAVLGIESIRRQNQQVAQANQSQMPEGMATAVPGSIPIYVNGELVGSFEPTDLEQLKGVSFQDAEEGKTQEGWLLRDILLLYVEAGGLNPDTPILVTSNHRGKSAQLTWGQVDDPANMVMFDLSGRGTLKLVSLLPQLDVRDEWVQDVDLIEIGSRRP